MTTSTESKSNDNPLITTILFCVSLAISFVGIGLILAHGVRSKIAFHEGSDQFRSQIITNLRDTSLGQAVGVLDEQLEICLNAQRAVAIYQQPFSVFPDTEKLTGLGKEGYRECYTRHLRVARILSNDLTATQMLAAADKVPR